MTEVDAFGIGATEKDAADNGAPRPAEAGERMIRYFRDCAAGDELPTFSGAAETLGVGVAALSEWRAHDPAFARAFSECRAILADHLIRQGLQKRYDASLVKFLLPICGVGTDGEEGPDELSVKIEVLEGGSPGNAV